ncbi:hypothetical protein BWI93_25755 [Siphonobacter sp. BAB-5385]|nr:hypothetical protein BWI93_25755 [Siphonobacter sp. BAB-5385]
MSRMKTQWFFLGVILLWMSGCTAVQVQQKSAVNFDEYRKFTFVKPDIQGNKNPLYKSGITDEMIQNAIASELTKKGLVQDDNQPDLLVSTHEYFENKTQQVANPAYPYPYYVPYNIWYRSRWMPVGYSYYYQPWNSGYHTEHYTEGTLIVDVIDAKTQQLLWLGSLENPVNDPAGLAKQFAHEAEKILARYPEHLQHS